MLFNRGPRSVALGGWAVAAVLAVVGPSAAAGAIPGAGGGIASGGGTTSGGVLYVDDDAPPGGDGQSWDTAFRYLQDALAEAYFGLGVDEIRIAQGTYRPDRDEAGHVTPGDREATFDLIDAITLKGGYASGGAPDPDERDIDLYETILSGDLAGDDEPGFINYEENSYHVVMVQFVPETVSFDGLTISGGNANLAEDSPAHLKYGGGVFVDNSAIALTDCTVSENRAENDGLDGGGGGISAVYSWLELADCTFVRNNAVDGGAIRWGSASVIVVASTFEENSAGLGGAIMDIYSDPLIVGCSFLDNYAESSGGAIMSVFYGHPTIEGCFFADNISDWGGGAIWEQYYCLLQIGESIFVDNASTQEGGAIHATYSDFRVVNTLFVENSSGCGGAIYRLNDHVDQTVLVNCVFISNDGSWGGAIYDEWTGLNMFVTNCTFTANAAVAGGAVYSDTGAPTIVSNSILCGDTGTMGGNEAAGTVEIYYSLVEGGWDGVGEHIIDADPRFVDVPGADGIVGTPDDDVRLLPGSPCIDGADNTALPPEVVTDLDGHPRYVDDPTTEDTGIGEPPIADMGAYEFRLGDVDYDGDVDVLDLLFLLGQWGECPPDTPCTADLDHNGVVNVADLLLLLGLWGAYV
jgi:hypothetical protein